VRIEPFRYQSTWAARAVPHFVAGLTGSRLLAAAALVSFDMDQRGRAQWLRHVTPRGEGANVVARVPARGDARRTLVLVAHHDAAHTGFMWRHPSLWGPRLSPGSVPPIAGGSELGLALVALGLRRLGRAQLLVSLLAALDVARSPTVPGASDNATGVAAVIALVERWLREPLDGTDVVALFPGCEESGMGGMAAWLRSQSLDPARTLVLGLDTLGAGEPAVVAAEGPPLRQTYRSEDLEWADRGAARAGIAPPRRFTIGGWTDPVLALMKGLPAISLVSVRDGGFTNYHLPTDTPDRVDWESVERCVRLAVGTAEAWSAGDR
jgi:Peptidase family M28